MKLTSLCVFYFAILLVAVGSVASRRSSSDSSVFARTERRLRWRSSLLAPSKKNGQDGRSVMVQTDDIKEKETEKRPSIWKRLGHRTSPAKLIRKQPAPAPALATKTFYGTNSSDPLHAYPNKMDLVVHKIFQQAATFEINNSRLVRQALTVGQISARVALIAGLPLVLAALAISVPVSNVLGRRTDVSVDDDEDEANDRVDDEHAHPIDLLAQNVINAIQNGEFKFH